MLIISIVESESSAWQDQTFAIKNISWDEVITLLFTGKYLKNRIEGAFRFQFEIVDGRVLIAISEENKPNSIELIMYSSDEAPLFADTSLRSFLAKLEAEAVLTHNVGTLAIRVANVQVNKQKIGQKPVLLVDKDIKEFVLLSKILKQIKSNLSDSNIKSQAVGRNGTKTFFFEITRYDNGSNNTVVMDGLELSPQQPDSLHFPPISNGETTQVLWRDTPSNVNEETEQGISVLAGIKSIYEPDTNSNINSSTAQH